MISLCPSTPPPPPLPPPPGVLIVKYLPRLRTFSFNLSFLCSAAGVESYPFEAVQLPGRMRVSTLNDLLMFIRNE